MSAERDMLDARGGRDEFLDARGGRDEVTSRAVRVPLAAEGKFAAVLENVLSAAECARLMARAEALGFESLEGEYPKAYRDNDRVIYTDEALAAAIFARLRPHVPAALPGDGREMQAVGCNERFRSCRYDPGGHFNPHHDGGFWRDGMQECTRLTVNVYLNDVPEEQGGATQMLNFGGPAASRDTPRVTDRVQPRAGSALVFEHAMLHEGCQFLPGAVPQKHLLRTDVMYRYRDEE